MVAPELGTASKGRGRLGPDFTKLWLAQGVSNLGDGVYVTALPLLAATLTRKPLPVSAVVFAEWLPWLLFGLLAGALLDRWDRRRVM
jgi:MFS family permease